MRSKKIRRFIVSVSSVLTIAVICSFSCLQSKAADWIPTIKYTVPFDTDSMTGGQAFDGGVYDINFSYTQPSQTSPNSSEGWVTASGTIDRPVIVVYVIIDLKDNNVRDLGPGRGVHIKGSFGFSPVASDLPADSFGDVSIVSGTYQDVFTFDRSGFTFANDSETGVQTLGSQGMYKINYDLDVFVPLYNDNGTPNTETFDQLSLAFRITPSGGTWYYPIMYISPIQIQEYDDVTIFNYGSSSDYHNPLYDILGGVVNSEDDLLNFIDQSWQEIGLYGHDYFSIVPAITSSLNNSFTKLKTFTSTLFSYSGSDFVWLFFILIAIGAAGMVVHLIPNISSLALKNRDKENSHNYKDDDDIKWLL